MIVHMIGNAHIDPVWLWRWQAGVDEAIASFASAAQRCDEYPEFIYTRGEAWLYRQVERLAPDLFARVRRLVSEGRWHITGGQYIQPDANGPTEEGWRRQMLHGRRYFEDRFGVRPTVGYNVDTFGHVATLPDILAPLGYRGYAFMRPDQRQLDLPSQTFRWQGPGGGEIVGFRIEPAYLTHTPDLKDQIMDAVAQASDVVGHTMCFYGVGNHGGGPTKANIEYILEHRHAFDGIELRFSTPEAFIDAVMPHWDRLPVVTAELQHCFPGCYIVMHDVKQQQRHAELLLEEAGRTIDGLIGVEAERTREHARLDAAWDDLLFVQFHDILAGTAVASAYPSVRAMQGRAQIVAEEIITDATRRWARSRLPRVNQQQIVLYNPTPVPWLGVVEAEPFLDFDSWGDRWISDLAGRPVPFQKVRPEAGLLASRIVFPAQVAAGSFAQLLVRDDTPPAEADVPADLHASDSSMGNRFLHVRLTESGIGGITFQGREMLGANGLSLHLRDDHSNSWGAGSKTNLVEQQGNNHRCYPCCHWRRQT